MGQVNKKKQKLQCVASDQLMQIYSFQIRKIHFETKMSEFI